MPSFGREWAHAITSFCHPSQQFWPPGPRILAPRTTRLAYPDRAFWPPRPRALAPRTACFDPLHHNPWGRGPQTGWPLHQNPWPLSPRPWAALTASFGHGLEEPCGRGPGTARRVDPSPCPLAPQPAWSCTTTRKVGNLPHMTSGKAASREIDGGEQFGSCTSRATCQTDHLARWCRAAARAPAPRRSRS